jgi:hypothetical protein
MRDVIFALLFVGGLGALTVYILRASATTGSSDSSAAPAQAPRPARPPTQGQATLCTILPALLWTDA